MKEVSWDTLRRPCTFHYVKFLFRSWPYSHCIDNRENNDVPKICTMIFFLSVCKTPIVYFGVTKFYHSFIQHWGIVYFNSAKFYNSVILCNQQFKKFPIIWYDFKRQNDRRVNLFSAQFCEYRLTLRLKFRMRGAGLWTHKSQMKASQPPNCWL